MMDGIYSTISNLKKLREFFPAYKETFDEMTQKLEEIKKLELKQIEELIKDGEVPKHIGSILEDFLQNPDSIRSYTKTDDNGQCVFWPELYVLRDMGFIKYWSRDGFVLNENMLGRAVEIVKRYKPDSYVVSEPNIKRLRKLKKW